MVTLLILLLIPVVTPNTSQQVNNFGAYKNNVVHGRCLAWCLERYGNYSTVVKDPNDDYEVCDKSKFASSDCLYRCYPGNTACASCQRGCLTYDGYRWECEQGTASCGEDTFCTEGCLHQFWMDETDGVHNHTLDWENMNNKRYPATVTEHSEHRTQNSIGIKWSYVRQTDVPKSMIFLIYVKISRSEEDQSDKYFKAYTPEHYFILDDVNKDVCYRFFVISTTNTTVYGGQHSKDLYANAHIHVENVTATSCRIWFKRRWCETELTYTLHLSSKQNGIEKEYFKLKSENGVHSTTVKSLNPNTYYTIQINRKDARKESQYFSYTTHVTTPLISPNSTAKAEFTRIKSDAVTVNLIAVQPEKMWNAALTNWSVTVTSLNGTVHDVRTVAGPAFSAAKEENTYRSVMELENLTPYTEYCVSVIAYNVEGAGPTGERNCTRTASAAPPRPIVKVMNPGQDRIPRLGVKPPSPPWGVTTKYHVSFIDNGTDNNQSFNATGEEPWQIIEVKGLDANEKYDLKVRAENAGTEKGEFTVVKVETPPDIPDSAPSISKCTIKADNSITVFDLTWRMDNDSLNGKPENYTVFVNITEEDGEGARNSIMYQQYTLTEFHRNIGLVKDPEAKVSYDPKLVVEMELEVTNSAGTSPRSKPFTCEIDASLKMGFPVISIVIPLCIAGVLIILLLGFFYFFRFKSYKETPYEEIKKLIRPDAFSPCQHCLHNKGPKRWDVFICYVSEDTNYVIQLKEAFERENIEVFFAKDELSWGCQLHRVINDGLRDSKYGLVVLSNSFIQKSTQWTTSELSSLHSKSRLTSQDCILPIWKRGVTEVEVGAYDITLVGIHSMKEEEMSCEMMAQELKKKLKKDSCWGCMLRNGKAKCTPPATPDTPGTCMTGITPLTSPESLSLLPTPSSGGFPTTEV